MVASDTRKPLFIDTAFVTVPVRRDVQKALEQYAYDHRAELDKALAVTGLSITEILVPTFERIVWAHETGFSSATSTTPAFGSSVLSPSEGERP